MIDCDNECILTNLLGTFYLDQESGWVVFNRGKIIGKNSLDIDQLIYGLSGLDADIFTDRKTFRTELELYREALNLYEEQQHFEDYFHQDETLVDTITKLQNELFLVKQDLEQFKKQKKLTSSYVEKNEDLWKYIDSLKLVIVDEGKQIRVTKDNILGLPEIQEYQIKLIKNLERKIKIQEKKKEALELQIQDNLNKVKDVNKLHGLGLRSSIKLDKKQTDSNREIISNHLKTIDDRIVQVVSEQRYVDDLNKKLKQYADALEISGKLGQNKITERNFQELSGTIKQKAIWAYRLSMMSVVSDYLGIKLPIIIDSISKETDSVNIESLLVFLKTYFSDHQIIISSILRIDDADCRIVLSERLMESTGRPARELERWS